MGHNSLMQRRKGTIFAHLVEATEAGSSMPINLEAKKTNQSGRPAERIASMSGAARIGAQPIPTHWPELLKLG